MKSLIVFALLIATAYGNQQVADTLDDLDDLLVEAHKTNNIRAIETIESAIDTVTFIGVQLETVKGAEAKAYQEVLDDIYWDMENLERMVKSEIKSRNWIASALKFMYSGLKMILGNVTSIFEKLNSSGYGGLIAIFQPFIDQIQSSKEVRGVIAGIKTVQQGISSLNRMTGGKLTGPINTIQDILNSVDNIGNLFTSMTANSSSDTLTDSLVNTLNNAKGFNLKKVTKGLNYVCNGLADAESAAAAA